MGAIYLLLKLARPCAYENAMVFNNFVHRLGLRLMQGKHTRLFIERGGVGMYANRQIVMVMRASCGHAGTFIESLCSAPDIADNHHISHGAETNLQQCLAPITLLPVKKHCTRPPYLA